MTINKLPITIKNEVIEIIDNKTKEKKFLAKKGDRWENITEEEYNKIRG